MASTFQLRIVTPGRMLLDAPVREVTAPGTAGEFGVLPDHITFLGSLEVGELRYRADGGDGRIVVRGGFAEVLGNVMTVLADAAMFPADIDPAAAKADAQAATAALANLSPLDPAYANREVDRRWAEARLALAGAR